MTVYHRSYSIMFLSQFMLNVFSHSYHLDVSISNFRFFVILCKFKKKLMFANSREPDQTSRFEASDLVLH